MPPPEPEKSLSHVLRNTTITVVLTFIVLIGVIVYAFATRTTVEAKAFAPLGDYPTQTITSTQPIPVEKTVGVTGTKCNTSTEDVEVIGDVSWQLVDFPGTAISNNRGGHGIRHVGCETTHFENPMPPGVIERVHQLAAQGTVVSTWVITGRETPIAPRGERAVTKAYRTDNFKISS